MDHIAHLSHLGQNLKIFFLYMHFIFFSGLNKQFNVTCKGGRCLGTPQACICDLGVGISVSEIIEHFLFILRGDVRGTTPYGHDYILSHVPWHKEQEYIWSMGGDLNSFSSPELKAQMSYSDRLLCVCLSVIFHILDIFSRTRLGTNHPWGRRFDSGLFKWRAVPFPKER
jgi:hypothetical protein